MFLCSSDTYFSSFYILHPFSFFSVFQGKRSCRADVWSFAVTIWEIFQNCKEIPYADLTVTQILENYGHWYQRETSIDKEYDDNNDKRNQLRIPSQSNHCPDNLYRIMKKCWSTRVEERPSFEEIHLYLEKLAFD